MPVDLGEKGCTSATTASLISTTRGYDRHQGSPNTEIPHHVSTSTARPKSNPASISMSTLATARPGTSRHGTLTARRTMRPGNFKTIQEPPSLLARSTDSSWANNSAKVKVPVGRSFLPSK